MNKPAKSSGRCVICGTAVNVVRNHVGGQHHLAWFWMWFCGPHHDQFHALVRAAGIDLDYTSDPVERLLRGLKAIKVCEWMLLEALDNLNIRRQGSETIYSGSSACERSYS